MDPFDLKDFSENDDTEAISLMNIATGVVLPDDVIIPLDSKGYQGGFNERLSGK